MKLLRHYNQELALIFFCIGLLFYALGISYVFQNTFHAQNFFYLGAIVFIFYNYRAFSRRAFQILLIPIICFALISLLGFLTYFDEVLPQKFSVIFKALNSNVFKLFWLFVIFVLYGLYARGRNVKFFLSFFAFLCALEVCATLYISFKNNFTSFDNVPFYFEAIYLYNLWLIAPAGLCMAGVLTFRGWWRKIACIGALGIVLLAMVGNGERSFLVGFVGMSCIAGILSVLISKYRHKLALLCSIFLVFVFLLAGLYQGSKSLSERYNFAHMLDSFLIVWNTPPVEMGQYDKACFNKNQKWLICAPESLEKGKNELSWDHSALARVNMGRSALLAFLDEPFKPHIIGTFQVNYYLWHYYQLKNPQNRSYITNPNESNKQVNGYAHPHSLSIALLFGYGLIGFACIVIFWLFLIYRAYRGAQSVDSWRSFWGVALFLCACGLGIQSFFDLIYNVILQPTFVFFGILIGLGWRDEDPSHTC